MAGWLTGRGPLLAATEREVTTSAVLEHVRSVHLLRRDEADQGQPVHLRGVTTCVLSELNAIVVEDSTGAIYVTDERESGSLPPLGEQVEIRGLTRPGIVRASQINLLGPGTIPEPIKPSWNQLMNGSLSCRWVEIEGVNESVLHRSNGWSRVNLRTQSGTLRVELRRAGVTPRVIDESHNAVIKLRGCMFADWNVANNRIKAGQIRMHDAELRIAEPPAADLFSLPIQSVPELMSFNPDQTRFQRVHVSGQVVFVLGEMCFVMDGTNGMRLLDVAALDFSAGDLVNAVGFPEWGYASPYIRVIEARRTGHAPLPSARSISAEELPDSSHDATLVRVRGVLSSLRTETGKTTLEIQSGSWRFLSRVYEPDESLNHLQLGSGLELTGVYCAQGAYRALGEDVAPIDLLIASPADIRVLTTPSWWTRERVLAGSAVLLVLLAAMALWATQLRRQVEQRTAEVRMEIQNRERAEKQQAIEAERARIAQDLHDELGADITEIGMMANRARSNHELSAKLLDQTADKTSQMVSKLEEIVWAMDPQNDSIEAVGSYLGFFADRFLGLANIKVQLEKNLSDANATMEARMRHQVFLVCKEALTNIVNHAAATEVKITLETTGGELKLAIADNGRGLPDHPPATGQNGIANMRHRIRELKGQFEITRGPTRGTTVKVSIPLA